MSNTSKVFGNKTIQDWIDIRERIIGNPPIKSNWEDAVELFDLRLNTRYFTPIKRILDMDIATGEGFAVMTLICSLIEFLQACWDGEEYKYGGNNSQFVYTDSGKKFKEFLKLHVPFKEDFSKNVSNPQGKIQNFADDFYSNVRCGLLHEASTKNNWFIKSSNSVRGSNFIDISDENNKIIYRENFLDALMSFIKSYKDQTTDGQDNDPVRNNFARKIDLLCEIRCNAPWWQ